jgi:alpha-D-xyloside xylohydrolase
LIRPRYLQSTLSFLAFLATLAANAGAQNVHVSQLSDGILVKTARDQLHIAVCGPSLLHLTAGPEAAKPAAPHQPWIIQACAGGQFSLTQSDKFATLNTTKLQVKIGLDNGGLIFSDASGNVLLGEGIWSQFSTRNYSLTQEGMYRVSETFQIPEDEAIYGLGQHQSGLMNYRGVAVSLGQNNTDVALPILISTRGYGLLWNTAAQSTMNNQFPRSLMFSAAAAEGLDYYFLYGPEPDEIIHLYRQLTGHAPLFGKWAYGLFQSKDRYKTQDELVGIADKYRGQHIPLDTVVQDWQWWTKWGSSDFNASYPDFAAAVKKIHDEHAHVMISVWPNFDPATPLHQQMQSQGFLIDDKGDYDVTNPVARDLYWKVLPSTLLAKGVDAFWLDASEPEAGELGIPPGHKLSFGDGGLYTNVFPFLHTLGIYENWRKDREDKRVFILTRSAFLGQQRNAAATWSGDVYSNFWALKHQVPAGLNFSISGIPYWTTDIGGYGYPNGDTSDPKYQEVFMRWFEYAAFCPIFRIHGHRQNDQNEIWAYGPATPALVKFDKLRYRMLPYIYSLAWQVTSNDYTIMRPLAMDWRTDRKVWDIGDEFMFGPALLVNPVTDAGATSRSVYLPTAAAWYDFWSGERVAGNQTIQAAAAIDRIPLYVRAGAILPLGPEIEYAGDKPDAPIELRVYRGADGSFTLYDDQGDSYAYEHDAYATLPITWDDASGTLTFGARMGNYPGISARKKFEIIWVGANHGSGPEASPSADKEVIYSGAEVRVKAP